MAIKKLLQSATGVSHIRSVGLSGPGPGSLCPPLGPEQSGQCWVGIQLRAEMGWWKRGVGVKEGFKVIQGQS